MNPTDCEGHPPGLSRFSIVSTDISWYGRFKEDERQYQVVICPGCGDRWHREYPCPGAVYDDYYDHECSSPELPRPRGRTGKDDNMESLTRELADELDWEAGEEFRLYANGTAALTPQGLKEVLKLARDKSDQDHRIEVRA